MIHGKTMMLAFADASGRYDTIAASKDCSVDLQTNLADELTKDDDDTYQVQEAVGLSGSIKTNMLLIENSTARQDAYSLLNLMVSRTPVKFRMNIYEGSKGKGIDDDNELSWNGVQGVTERVLMEGWAIIDSLDITANNKETATASAGFKIKGRPVFIQEEEVV